MNEIKDLPSNVIDIRSKSIAEHYRKHDPLIYSDSQDLLKLLPELIAQNKLEEGDQWVTFFFGLFVTENIFNAINDSGYDETLPLLSFCSGVNSVLEDIQTEIRQRERALEIEEPSLPLLTLSALSKMRNIAMDEDRSASSNVVDIGSRSIAARERKYDELMASMYSDSLESLKLLSALVSQHEPEKGDHWVAFYFGWIVTQDLVRAMKQTGYEEIPPLKSFCLGVGEALQDIATEVRRRFEKASEKTEVNPLREVWYQFLEDQTSEALESPQDEQMICGEIGFFGLTDWWLTEFNERERNEIERRSEAQPGRGELTRMKIASIQGVLASPVGFLTKLASWFPNAADFHIAKRILDKAEFSISDDIHVLAKDAFYREKIKHYYKQRDRHPSALGIAIEACEQQIELSRQAATAYLHLSGGYQLPWHYGFKQLAIIREKERDYESAIALAERAKEEGWGGDWEKRIARCKKRLKK